MTPIIIAEIGSSPAPEWNFSKWIIAALEAGATHVKVQIFRAEHFPKEEQDSKRPLEFPRLRFAEFVKVARQAGLKAGASVFDNDAVALVACYGDFLKLAAREQENLFLRGRALAYSISQGKTLYRSISTFDDTSIGITLFAIQRYPAPMVPAIFSLIKFSRFMRGEQWGWSSHTRGDLDCRLAARLGASVIEKHLVINDDDLEAGHALKVKEFAKMVKAIKGSG